MYRSLRTGRESKLAFYRKTMLLEWLLVLFTVAIFLMGGISLRLLGLYNPHGFIMPPGLMGGITIGICVGLIVVVLLNILTSGHRQQKRTQRPVRVGDFHALLPQTPKERLMFALVAVTAGICEEILFRGLPVYVLDHQFPNLGPILVIVITALIFGWVHYYQGWRGIIGTAVLGGLFTSIYLATGALWIPMILHSLIDLRVVAERSAAS